jgi:ADP-ribose pyrophosphatase YjhB (NUDIX family)
VKREYPDRPVVAVGAAVCRDGQVLIVRRGKPPSVGIWTVPGGAVQLGESMSDAAAREVREECGIEVEVGEVVGVLDHVYRDDLGAIQYHYAIVDFAARYLSGRLQPSDELRGALWVAPGQFDNYDVPAKSREVLLRALRSWEFPGCAGGVLPLSRARSG